MVKAINDTPDAIFEREVSTYLDLTKFVNHIAIESFLAEDDGILGYAGLNNFYFYRFEDSKRSQFLAWDKDNTFHDLDFDIMKGVNENVLARRTLAQPQYRNRYFQQLIDAANSAMEPDGEGQGNSNNRPGWLEREVARMSAQIRSAGLRRQFQAVRQQRVRILDERPVDFRARARRSRQGAGLPAPLSKGPRTDESLRSRDRGGRAPGPEHALPGSRLEVRRHRQRVEPRWPRSSTRRRWPAR